jgi:uncharacterized membrane protein
MFLEVWRCRLESHFVRMFLGLLVVWAVSMGSVSVMDSVGEPMVFVCLSEHTVEVVGLVVGYLAGSRNFQTRKPKSMSAELLSAAP